MRRSDARPGSGTFSTQIRQAAAAIASVHDESRARNADRSDPRSPRIRSAAAALQRVLELRRGVRQPRIDFGCTGSATVRSRVERANKVERPCASARRPQPRQGIASPPWPRDTTAAPRPSRRRSARSTRSRPRTATEATATSRPRRAPRRRRFRASDAHIVSAEASPQALPGQRRLESERRTTALGRIVDLLDLCDQWRERRRRHWLACRGVRRRPVRPTARASAEPAIRRVDADARGFVDVGAQDSA